MIWLSHLSHLDMGAALLLLLCMFGMTWVIRSGVMGRRSTGEMVSAYRVAWMRQAARRTMRIADAAYLNGLRSNTGFFASGVLLAIGGVFALFANLDRLRTVMRDVLGDDSTSVEAVEIKLLFVLAILIYSFLQFVWAQRVFGYCSVVMAAMPEDTENADETLIEREAQRAAKLNILAARSFNRGLRAVYFAMAAMAWFAGAGPLIGATVLTVFVLMRREFASNTREALKF